MSAATAVELAAAVRSGERSAADVFLSMNFRSRVCSSLVKSSS